MMSAYQQLKNVLGSKVFCSVSEFKLTFAIATGNVAPLIVDNKLLPFLAVRLFDDLIYYPWLYNDKAFVNLMTNVALLVDENFIDTNESHIEDFAKWLNHSNIRF